MPFIQANKLTKMLKNRKILSASLACALSVVSIVASAAIAQTTTTVAAGSGAAPELRPALNTTARTKAIRSDTATAVKMARMRLIRI